ncbi:MAG: chemotaxis protein CheX [Deltaproteobacteria bacterium]|nr:chemotaxis protein CheX [Deltaproteobacteria bacterium]
MPTETALLKADFINPFVSSSLNVLQTMARVTPKVGKAYLKESRSTWGVVSGVIGMAGNKVTGNVILSFDQPCILEIVSNMLMEQFETISADVVDAVGELTNMITGGAKTQLGELGYVFEMATPMMITGQNIELSQLSKAPVVVLPFDTSAGRFVIEASFAPAKGAE